MATAIQRKAQIDPSRICTALLGKLLVAALILVPLAAMLFLEPRHRSGSTATASTAAAPAARSPVKDPLANPCSPERLER